jgi:hypothetical protein
MKLTIETNDIADVRTTPRGAGVETEFRIVRYKNMWQINGRATHSVADTATLILGVLHAMNEAKLGEGT